MNEQMSMKEIEKKARSTLRRDGLATIIAGVALAIMAPFFLDDRLGWMLILGSGLYVFLPEVLRRHFIYPRVGYVKVRKEKSKKWKLIISILLLLIFIVILKINAYNWILPFYLALVLGAMAFTIAYLYRTLVEYVLASLILASGIVGLVVTIQGNEPGLVSALQLWILGAVLVLVGTVRFVLFIRKYPATKEQVNETMG